MRPKSKSPSDHWAHYFHSIALTTIKDNIPSSPFAVSYFKAPKDTLNSIHCYNHKQTSLKPPPLPPTMYLISIIVLSIATTQAALGCTSGQYTYNANHSAIFICGSNSACQDVTKLVRALHTAFASYIEHIRVIIERGIEGV
jgi:hypothetical protein